MVIGVNTAESGDPFAKAAAFRDKHQLTYPILVDADNKAAERFGVQGYPTNVVIDREGKIRYLQAGFDRDAVTAILRELMKQ